MRQEAPYKICRCGRGKVYTAEQDKLRNAVVNGRRACNECKLDEIYAKLGVR